MRSYIMGEVFGSENILLEGLLISLFLVASEFFD